MKAKTTTISAQVFSNTTGFIKKKGNIYTSLKEKKKLYGYRIQQYIVQLQQH